MCWKYFVLFFLNYYVLDSHDIEACTVEIWALEMDVERRYLLGMCPVYIRI